MPLTAPPPARYLATVPPQEILPVVSDRFESSVPGIYVVGDVTGTPLVKVAANQGAAVVIGMSEQGAFRRPPGDDGPLDVVIIGAGPAGVSAAVEAQKRGLRYVVLERGKLVGTVRAFPPGKKVYAEPRALPNRSELGVGADLDRDAFLAMVERLVADRQLHVKEDTEVTGVSPVGDHRFEVATAGGQVFPARNVIIAVGRQGQPRLLDCPGADRADRVSYRLHNPEDYRDKDILVVGGGNSAIEAALLLAGHNRVTLSYRGTDFFRAKDGNRRQLDEAVAADRLRVVYQSEVGEVRETEVSLVVAGKHEIITSDHVIVLIGTLPPVEFLLNMGLELDGVWTRRRFGWAALGLLIGVVVYFFAKLVVLRPEDADGGKILVPGVGKVLGERLDAVGGIAFGFALPILWLLNLAVCLVNVAIRHAGRTPFVPPRRSVRWLVAGGFVYATYHVVANLVTTTPELAGGGPYYLPGFSWAYRAIPAYFSNLSGLYYLLYFAAITGFGLCWAVKSRRHLVGHLPRTWP